VALEVVVTGRRVGCGGGGGEKKKCTDNLVCKNNEQELITQ